MCLANNRVCPCTSDLDSQVGAGVVVGAAVGISYVVMKGKARFQDPTVVRFKTLVQTAEAMISGHKQIGKVLGTPLKVKQLQSAEVVQKPMHALFSVECTGPSRSGIAVVQAVRHSIETEDWNYSIRLKTEGRKQIVFHSKKKDEPPLDS